MGATFEETIKQRSDDELQEYLNNKSSYRAEAILAVIAELKRRDISHPETESIRISIAQKQAAQVDDLSFEPREGIPLSISKAAKALYISVAIGVISPIILQFTTELGNLYKLFNLAVILISTAIAAFFAYQIGLGKKWARTVVLIVFVIGLLPAPVILPDSFSISPLIGLLSLAQILIPGYALLLLFKREARAWYAQQ